MPYANTIWVTLPRKGAQILKLLYYWCWEACAFYTIISITPSTIWLSWYQKHCPDCTFCLPGLCCQYWCSHPLECHTEPLPPAPASWWQRPGITHGCLLPMRTAPDIYSRSRLLAEAKKKLVSCPACASLLARNGLYSPHFLHSSRFLYSPCFLLLSPLPPLFPLPPVSFTPSFFPLLLWSGLGGHDRSYYDGNGEDDNGSDGDQDGDGDGSIWSLSIGRGSRKLKLS